MYSTESESGKKFKLGWEINLYIHRMLLIVSIALVNPIFSDFGSIRAQENAYPLQMSEGKKSHRPEVPGLNGLVLQVTLWLRWRDCGFSCRVEMQSMPL